MPTRSFIRSRSGSRDGVALVMVLAFIVLLTILIVSFIAFTRLNRVSTASYSKAIQAQEIAQGGIEDILSDLHQEILAGSTVQTNGSSADAPVYVPTTNYTAQPARFGYATNLYGTDITSANLPPTLIRVSRASQDGTPTDFYPPLPSYYTNGLMTNRASAANSSTSSTSGRSISAARWNKIDLLTTNSIIPPAFATNTPDWVYVTRGGSRACTQGDLTSLTTSILPTTNLISTNEVVGRYAYAVYDEGALLDINAAGYISGAGNTTSGYATNAISTPATNNPAGIAQNLSSKSYLAYADLTQLPGLAGAQTTVIDPLIQWRNASVALGTASSAATNFFQMVFTNAQNGFLVFQTSGNGTDSPLLGRQDLINYFAKIDPAGTSYAAALPFLGTFSRAGNAPSWNPTLNAIDLPGYDSADIGKFITTSAGVGTVFHAIRYKDNAEQTTDIDGSTDENGTVHVANRDIPNVRYTTTETITHYNDDGTSYAYTVNPGDPVVQHRFSLAKLAWLTYKGPSADLPTSDPLYNAGGTDANILACFGLQWDPQPTTFSSTGVLHYDRWDYVASPPVGSGVHILSLDEIANGCTVSANPGYREPNFFEMLKAGILSGSLGQSPGPFTTDGGTGPLATDFDKVSSEKNRHILQIGANIIDQADSDSIPTAIYLQLTTPGVTEIDLTENTVFGDENLPGLTRFCQQAAEDWVAASQTGTKGDFKTWIIPEIWNIHQPPANGVNMSVAGTPGYPRPTQFRIHAYGDIDEIQNAASTVQDQGMDYDDFTTSYSYHDASSGPLLSGSPPGGNLADITGGQVPNSSAVPAALSTSSPAGLLYFTDSPTDASPFYRFPEFLQSASLYPTASGMTPFNGTNPLNLCVPGYDTQMADDYANDSVPPSGNYQGIQFAAIFTGENQTFYNRLPPATSTNDLAIQYGFTAISPFYLSLECQDPNGHWHPYNFISRVQPTGLPGAGFGDDLDEDADGIAMNYEGPPGTSGSYAVNGRTTLTRRGTEMIRPDPRTDRFSVIYGKIVANGGGGGMIDNSLNPSPTANYGVQSLYPWPTWGFVYTPDSNGWYHPAAWAVNSISGGTYYVDQDGVVRPGDSYRENTATGDGALLYAGTGTTTSGGNITPPPSGPDTTPDGTGSLLPTSTGVSPTGSAQARRPVILNRPFRSVGELGYVFRDLPFKTLDFSSQYSADGALLDLFSVTDEPAVAAGEVNPSNAPVSVLKAIFTGATKMEINDPAQTANFMTQAEATAIAPLLAAQLQAQPLDNRADLVKALDIPPSPILTREAALFSPNFANKAYAEAPIRALAGVANTRTWNLLIDIIAQSGEMSPTATSLDNFVVQGEKRYWLHIAIDRYTGKIIDQQLEPVYE